MSFTWIKPKSAWDKEREQQAVNAAILRYIRTAILAPATRQEQKP